MITSKYIIKLSEEYFNTKNIRGFDVVIYKNPTLDEIKSLRAVNSGVRFIADAKSKKVYVWDANKSIHNDIFSSLVSWGAISWDNMDYYINGIASVFDSGRMTFTVWDFANRPGEINSEVRNYVITIMNQDWAWLDRYIPGASQYIKRRLSELKSKNSVKFS